MSNPQETATTPPPSTDYKAKLDEVATKARQPPQNEEEKPEGTGAVIVDKVSQIIPAVKKVLGQEESQPSPPAPEKEANPPSEPPLRPAHDPQIAEFLRDQHKSIEIGSLDE